MNTLNLIIGGLLLISLGLFFSYAALAVRHAIRFRYLSKRTVYFTLGFIAFSGLLILSSLGLYGVLLFQ